MKRPDSAVQSADSHLLSWYSSMHSVILWVKRRCLMMNQEKIGLFLKRLRNEKGLTQEELAEKLYVNSRSVSRWENARTMPDFDVLI